jgi:hypothetical protein
MSTYRFVDAYHNTLKVEPSEGDAETAYIEALSGAHVPAADLPEIVANLYRAAGQEPPILLSRHKPEPIMTRDGKVRAANIPSGEDMTPADALDMASWYATAAEKAAFEALSQPDPAHVAALAEVIRDLAEQDVLTSDDDGKAVARAILAAGYARTEGKA